MNIKIEHKEQEPVEAGSEVKVGSLRDILKIAQTHPIACISACTDKNANQPDKRAKATEDLETKIAERYDYISVNGGWVEPTDNGNTKETVEESFIVIGPEYEDYEIEYFRNDMIELCKFCKQWAVLYISWVEDFENIDEYTKKQREDAYRVFSDPKYIDDNKLSELDDLNREGVSPESIRQDAETAYEEIINKDSLDLTELYGEYLDGNGRTVKVFNNVNTGLIGSYFTTTARKAGAQKFTLLASTMRFYTRYVANNLANKYIVGWNSTHPIEEQREILLGGRGKYYYEKASETLNSYIAGETKWENGEYKPWKESFEKEK